MFVAVHGRTESGVFGCSFGGKGGSVGVGTFGGESVCSRVDGTPRCESVFFRPTVFYIA